ncbi:uncharacterized protein C8A04DRAFT_15510 [Dichotomopilus funicola]|uniref:Uncharacterized protein n=1 Tax=Dichotomopilus funicola TaxID=1934379 RepID=A0AAN6UVL2_9PEZI|nr:hypothetical protein C8A04DRAFT_15510 [Dichotomopilus funicola]
MWWRAIAHAAHLLAHSLACAAEPGCGLDWTHILGEEPIFFVQGLARLGSQEGRRAAKTPPIRSQMTRVVPRQVLCYVHPVQRKKILHCTPSAPLPLGSDKRRLARAAAFGPLQNFPHHTSCPARACSRYGSPSTSYNHGSALGSTSQLRTLPFTSTQQDTPPAPPTLSKTTASDHITTTPTSSRTYLAFVVFLVSDRPNTTRLENSPHTRTIPTDAMSFDQPSTYRSSNQTLSPSASHTSLCSIRSTSSAGLDTAQLTEKAAKELRAYARSFESVRLQRRRSA